MAGRLRAVLLTLIGVLYVLSIPWYREPGGAAGRWLGLPDWVAVALICYVAVAVLNSVAWSLTDMSDEAPPDLDEEPRP
jgi:hypothetical protein